MSPEAKIDAEKVTFSLLSIVIAVASALEDMPDTPKSLTNAFLRLFESEVSPNST